MGGHSRFVQYCSPILKDASDSALSLCSEVEKRGPTTRSAVASHLKSPERRGTSQPIRTAGELTTGGRKLLTLNQGILYSLDHRGAILNSPVLLPGKS
jgi:hypothetical protein